MGSCTIAVGLDADPGKGDVDLILLPDEAPPEARPGLTVLAPLDLTRALYLMRERYADHRAIATLGGATVIGTRNPEWTTTIERRVAEFLDDLGNCPLDSWSGAFNAIRNGDRLASESTSAGLIDSLAGRPAICLGAGPSATPAALAQIARLAKNHVVFATDSMAKACRESGFAPHFTVMLERTVSMAGLVRGYGKGTTLIAPPVIDPVCVEEFERVCWWWAGDPLYQWLAPTLPIISAGRSAGTLSVSAAIIAGCNPIYLIGHDLCYAPGKAGHSTVAHDFSVTCQREVDARPANGNYHYQQFEVPGYCNGPVRTNGTWNLFRGDIETMVACNPSVQFYSAGEWLGATIAGVPVKTLPSCGPANSAVPAFPPLAASTVSNPRSKLSGIVSDLKRLTESAAMAQIALQDDACPLDDLAGELAVSRLVSSENLHLFHYILRSVNSALSLRLHLHHGRTVDPTALQRDCLGLLVRTIPPLCGRIAQDLATL